MNDYYFNLIDQEREKKWDDFIARAGGFFLQSWEWGSLQLKLGRQICRLKRSTLHSQLISYNLPFGKKYLYAPRGPVLIRAGELVDFHDMLRELKQNIGDQIIFLRIEPALNDEEEISNHLSQLGFKRTASAQPESTLVLDLKKPEGELLNEMEYETRYAIRAAKRRGVKISKAQNLGEKKRIFENFWPIFEATNARHHLKAYPKNYYREVLSLTNGCRSEIFAATVDNKIISSAIIVFFGERAVYLYSASARGYGRFNAPTLLLWEMILEARRLGSTVFDFWGISHENKKWTGITAFKKSFGGEEVRYTGTWDLIFNRKWYWLYTLIKGLRRH